MTALPLRDGVGASRVRLPVGDWADLLGFFCAHFPHIARDEWASRFARGLVSDETGLPLAADAPYRPGTTLRYYRELPPEPRVPFEADILYRDEHLLVVDKPHFLPVVPAGRFVQETLLVRLKKALGLPQLAPLHRIDRATAGLTLFSLDPATRGVYQALFAQRRVHKVYDAVAPRLRERDVPFTYRSRLVRDELFFRTREAPGAPNSETRVELLAAAGELGHYRLVPLTGRKHQLRVHMAALGAPIVNDPLYPALREEAAGDYSQPLQLLARELIFTDPLSGERRHFISRRRLDFGFDQPPAL